MPGQDSYREGALTERWAERQRIKPRNLPSDVLKGRPREEWIWSPGKKAKFIKMWNDGVLIKVIMHELDIGSKQAVSQQAKALGLKSRLRNGGIRPLIKVRLDEPDMAYVRRRATELNTTISKYVTRLIRLDKGG